MDETTAAPGPPPAIDALAQLSHLLREEQRPDLADRVAAAYSRAVRPATVVCVVGQFKEGKSSLVNALLGADVCPVDDDLATSAITVVRYGDELQASVRRRDGERTVDVPVAVEELDQWVSEVGNPGNAKQVERVDITVPSSLLADGLVLVDTPGMGGLGAGHAAATLGFLRFADALVLVSDATSELTAPELEFLDEALQWCPTAMLAQTKIDLATNWQRIVALNAGHLQERGVALRTVAVSSALRAAAFERRNRALNDRSGYPELIRALTVDVAGPSKARALSRAAADARGAAQLLRSGLVEELELLADPSRRQAVIERMEQAKATIEHLRGPGARWSTVMGDRIGDISNAVTFEFRQRIKSVTRGFEAEIEELSKGDQWDDMIRRLQSDVATAVADAFAAIESSGDDLRAELAGLLRDEVRLEPGTARQGGLDTASMWTGAAIAPAKKDTVLGTSLTGLRGATSGLSMLSTVSRFLPTACTTLLALNPVLFAIGAAFGGAQVFDMRKRKVAERRQRARLHARQFLDDVQTEVSNEIGGALRTLQRDLRDEISARLTELLTSCTATMQQAQQQVQQDDATTRARLAAVSAVLPRVDALVAVLEAVPDPHEDAATAGVPA